MDNELLRNGSGYVDLTAYKAIQRIEGSKNQMEFKRGEIFEYEKINTGEIKKALVVSADFRSSDKYLNVIILTDEPKGEVNVRITCQGIMYADCGMVSFATNDRLGNFIRKASEKEMAQIDEGIAQCLGLEQKTVEIPSVMLGEALPPVMEMQETFNEELATAKAEAKIYRELYEKMFAKMIG